MRNERYRSVYTVERLSDTHTHAQHTGSLFMLYVLGSVRNANIYVHRVAIHLKLHPSHVAAAAVYLYFMVNIVNYEYYCWENNIV